MDLFELYQNQEKLKNNELFKKFNKEFTSFFDDSDQYDKDINGNEYILTNKHNKNNKKVITPPIYINLYETFFHLNKEIKHIYDKSLQLIEEKNDIEKDSEKFNNYKLDYKVKTAQIKQCNEIFDDQNKEINNLQHQLIDLKLLLGKKYIERQLLYDKLKDNPIRRTSKKELFRLYKINNLKVPDKSSIQKAVKKINVHIDDAIKWIEWFDICKTYIEIQLNIQNNMKIIRKTKKQNNLINNNFLIVGPKISDKKDVKMNIKVPKIHNKNNVVIKKIE
jgi:hypothetical protein